MPDARAGEAVDHADAQLLGGPGGVLHFLGGAAADAVRLAVAPDVRRQDRLVPGVDVVQHALADQVIRDGKHLQVVLFEQVAFAAAVRVVGEGLVDLEVVAPAGQLEPVVAELAGFFAQRFEGQIGPLTGEQRDGASHCDSFFQGLRSGGFMAETPVPRRAAVKRREEPD